MLGLLPFLLLLQLSQVEPIPSIAINRDRAQLMKDALGWMTFRKNGVLMEDSELRPLFLDTILKKYATSKMYRTFVIAFHQGVLPRLTLNENDPCDPSYTSEYKDPFNSSVTWYYQKRFTFDAYDESDFPGVQFCDYRQGLVCKPLTKKCQCPEGSSMQPISGSSPVQRCLLDQDEICGLVDIDQGLDRKHSSLASNLYHMIFNLEKPPSCKEGSQCRFKIEDLRMPRCYDVNNGTWFPGPNDTLLLPTPSTPGEECVLGLYSDIGSCKVREDFEGGYGPGYVCYNYGPPRTTPAAENRTGFCSSEWGNLGISFSRNIQLTTYYRPFFIAFVHPRTVPLREEELKNYYLKYLSKVSSVFSLVRKVEHDEVGDRCNVSKTKVMEDAWKYFSSLEDNPPPGQDYVPQATPAELEAELQKVIDLLDNLTQKVCKVYWNFYQEEEHPALTCVPDGSTDADGNDGTCQKSGDETKPFARWFKRFIETTLDIREDLENEEKLYRKDILLKNPEPPCLPSVGPLPSLQARYHNPDTLEGGLCPEGAVCYEDFSDSHDLYDFDCNLKNGTIQHLYCHDVSTPLENCERQLLEKKVSGAIRNLDEYASLEEGDACHYQFELALRQNEAEEIGNWNRYLLLHWVERGILCNTTGENLKCTMEGTCKNCEDCDDDDDEDAVTESLELVNLEESGVNYISSSCPKVFIKVLLSLVCPLIITLL